MIKDPVKIEETIDSVLRSPKTVSVMMMSRNRIHQAIETIHNVSVNATNPDKVEFIMRLDDDDENSLSQIEFVPPEVKVLVGPRLGYQRAHEAFYEMTLASSAEFVMVFTDDFEVAKGWDSYIGQHRGEICVIFTNGELTFATSRVIPLVWERFGIWYSIDVHYKIIALDLGAYVRHDEIGLVHNHRGAVRDYVADIRDYMWPKDKPLIYEMTDILRPYVNHELYKGFQPITGRCNTWAHPINDYARGKIYWWPIAPETDPMYWKIKEAESWFHPGSNWHYEGE